MSETPPTRFWIVVFRDAQIASRQKFYANVSGLTRFCETERENTARGVGGGPFDVWLVDLEEMCVVPYDVSGIQAAIDPKSACSSFHSMHAPKPKRKPK
jgi:hypothetical protein